MPPLPRDGYDQGMLSIVGTLIAKPKNIAQSEIFEPIVGGYSNARGDVALLGESLTYRVNSRNKTIRLQPGLNSQAQIRYDAAAPGEVFQYCGAKFLRLSDHEIVEICAAGPFGVAPRFVQ